MDKKLQKEEKVERTLQLLDEPLEIKPDPNFYTKLEQRISHREKPGLSFSGWLKPALAGFLLMINISTAVWYLSDSGQTSRTDQETKLIKYLAGDLINGESEYSLFNTGSEK